MIFLLGVICGFIAGVVITYTVLSHTITEGHDHEFRLH